MNATISPNPSQTARTDRPELQVASLQSKKSELIDKLKASDSRVDRLEAEISLLKKETERVASLVVSLREQNCEKDPSIGNEDKATDADIQTNEDEVVEEHTGSGPKWTLSYLGHCETYV